MIFSQFFLCILVVSHATRIAPVDSIAHVSSFQSRLRSLYDLWSVKLMKFNSNTDGTEEVGHDHVRTKSGRVAPYITLYKM